MAALSRTAAGFAVIHFLKLILVFIAQSSSIQCVIDAALSYLILLFLLIDKNLIQRL